MSTINEKLIAALKDNQIDYLLSYPLNKLTTFRIGGNADIFCQPNSPEKILILFNLIYKYNINYFFLGGGSNILISDMGFQGIVIYPNIKEEFNTIELTNKYINISVPATVRAPWFAKQISNLGYTGLEFLTTIPGQLGGSIIQNAGCYGSEIKDIINEVTIIDNGIIKKLKTNECNFKYRYSMFKDNKQIWVLSATFTLPKGIQTEIDTKIETYKQKRLQSQPRNRRSAGSIFKNPSNSVSNLKAWELIHKTGLVGTIIGDAQISNEHANFIVNLGKATANDVYQLIQLIESKVIELFNIQLEKEVILIGKF